jgi:hypothetical protein
MTSKTTSSDDQTMPITGTLRVNLEALSVALSRWERRDDTRPQPEIRRAANTAMDEIDAMLRELHTLRGSWCPRSATATTPGRTHCSAGTVRHEPPRHARSRGGLPR